jgi:general secretion pathway protein B
MSFILDALRKSDQQRHRGAAPTLLTSPSLAAEPKRPAYWMQGLLAAVLIAAGVAIGWLHPWQTEQPAVQPIVSATSAAPQSTPRQAAPTAWPETNTAQQPPQKPMASAAPSGTALEWPASSPSSVEARSTPVTAAAIQPPTPPAEKLAGATASATEQKAIAMNELPAAIRQELPAMNVLLHQYSPKPNKRFVTINNQTLQEGESVAPGIRLEQITPDGMTLSYKGYHFRRGVLQ